MKTIASATYRGLREAALAATWALWLLPAPAAGAEGPSRRLDFNLDIRPILSNTCFACHGPDEKKRKGGDEDLRLDTRAGAFGDRGGYAAVVPGKPGESELVARITASDAGDRMPPRKSGKKLTAREVELLTEWVRQGAPWAEHWSYEKPVRPRLPAVRKTAWPRNAVDHFVLERLEREGLEPSAEASRHALVRRLSLDLTGLPPGLEEVERFVGDPAPDAYEKLVDRLLSEPSFGEHWARIWLDLARYADSAGYADDPPRTIWAFRDYVVRSLSDGKPFDRFTIEQIAGDLLPEPTEEQLVATAFHRNTLTNNEGGTDDEEFRNVAIVDRVNTTFAVWMGTTIACAQCHNHKYDPISQEEFFRVFAIFNSTEDADRRDESPRLPLFSAEQKENRATWQRDIAALEKTLSTSTPELAAAQARWERTFAEDLEWQPLAPGSVVSAAGAKVSRREDGSVLVERGGKTDSYTVELPFSGSLTALRLETLPDDGLPGKGSGHGDGNFVVSRVSATLVPPGKSRPSARFVRISIPGKQKILSLAEVEVLRGEENLARKGTARQSSTDYEGPAKLAIDGNTDGRYHEARSTTHTKISDDPWWEVDLGTEQPLERIVVWNRTDNGLHTRLKDFRIALLDAGRQPLWEEKITEPPNPSARFAPSGERDVRFASAFADYTQKSFDPSGVLDEKDPAKRGWAVGGRTAVPHWLALLPAAPLEAAPGSRLRVRIDQLSKHEFHTVGRFRIAASEDVRVAEYLRTPGKLLGILRTAAGERPEAERRELTQYYIASVAPELAAERERLAALRKQLAGTKPATSVPIQRELPEGRRRKTLMQRRGNFLETGKEVTRGLPAAFHSPPSGQPVDRLALGKWLVDERNPLTARVVANRLWEQVFGGGIVRTSEEFGSQGERPSHPELLDWLATELVRGGWDIKAALKLLVTSATYRQSSRVTPELWERDPDNRLLARGPRFRISAEMVRDQALAVSGLLSRKLGGPPVRPPQPTLGVSAAFGGGIDWKTSAGEDRYRRGLYTTWRRSNPYPSMATFDAPNREVCTVRRARTNTPLQALVTLNDPVYVEAAQALARRMARAGATPREKARRGFRLCLARPPSDAELERLVRLFEAAYRRFAADADRARQMATEPLGPLPEGADVSELAAWTVVGNVLLNLDEMLMKR